MVILLKEKYVLFSKIWGVMKYIVLLRGINISGKNKISMEELKKYLIENEYQSVYTYLNSGNIILESNELNKENIEKNIHSLIKEKFDLEFLQIKYFYPFYPKMYFTKT